MGIQQTGRGTDFPGGIDGRVRRSVTISNGIMALTFVFTSASGRQCETATFAHYTGVERLIYSVASA